MYAHGNAEGWWYHTLYNNSRAVHISAALCNVAGFFLIIAALLVMPHTAVCARLAGPN